MAYVDKRVRGERRIANLSMGIAAPGVEHHAHRVISFHHPAQRMGGIAWLRLHLIPSRCARIHTMCGRNLIGGMRSWGTP